MTNPYLTSEFMASLKYRGFLPNTPATSSNSELLRLATEEARTYIMALLKSVREEYGVYSTDVDLEAGTDTYTIPVRASGQALRHVAYVDSTGYEIPLNAVDPANRSLDFGRQTTGEPAAYVLQGNHLIVLPTPDAGYTLRLKYLARPNRLVYPTAVGQITAINTGTRACTLQIPEYTDLNGVLVDADATVPDTFTSNATYDFVRGEPGFESLAIDQSATVASNVLTFSSALPDDLAVGDFVCLAGESPIPQIPVECHELLAQRLAYKEAAVTTSPKAKALKVELDEMRKDVMTLLTPRVSSASRVMVYRHGPGFE